MHVGEQNAISGTVIRDVGGLVYENCWELKRICGEWKKWIAAIGGINHRVSGKWESTLRATVADLMKMQQRLTILGEVIVCNRSRFVMTCTFCSDKSALLQTQQYKYSVTG